MIEFQDIRNEDSLSPNAVIDPKVIELERYLRLAADFDNYKKRVSRDREREASAQKMTLVSDLLPVVDNLERALANKANAELADGVKMILISS